VTTAAARWRRDLEAWALPQHLLDAVPESPYGWPLHLWHRMQQDEAGESPTTAIVGDLLGERGTLLDVGAGTGRASLPIAALGHPLTAVEPKPGMVEGLRHEAGLSGVAVRVFESSWPESAAVVGEHDVVLCANVVYDVPDLGPFLEAFHGAARVGVVLEVGTRHPWSGLKQYYRALHGLDRPDGPTVGLLVQVVRETVGTDPEIRRWQRPVRTRFADLQELLDLYRRRLVLPVERSDELLDLLAPDVVEEDGWLSLGTGHREQATLWWRFK